MDWNSLVRSSAGLVASITKFERIFFISTIIPKILTPPLSHRSSAAVLQFITSDPVHGPALKAAEGAANFAYVGAAVGAITTGGNAWRWSKSPHGTVLSFAFGAVVGFTLGAEAANHWYQLYRLDTVGAHVKFNEWLQKRT
ncbi:succinate dehydrogenase subunit 6, mitochondrial-like [Salvia splendens]|uniref:succinate dehydrogenase subunit 6, mitochondrial-like n=1 Tax=Salvia splendens TaxID=180675 RepID=UPI001C271CC1|nr:succinate dehydrogenase subunit 6, mitochondrial-like [Salvia splendens]